MSTSTLGFRKATVQEIAGTLDLSVAKNAGKTTPVRTGSTGVLRLMQPLYLDDSGQLTYIVVNPGGAYFGEKYRMHIDVEPGSHLLLSSQGATRIYRTPKEPAVQEMTINVGEGSRFEYVPDQTIAYKDASYRQQTTVAVAESSQAFFGEIVTPGWDPDQKWFSYTGMHLRTEVQAADGGMVCIDNVRIEPSAIGQAIDGMGYFEGASHMGSALVIGAHTAGDYGDRVREIVDASGLDRVGVTQGERHGVAWLMVRALANSTDDLHKLILTINEHDRAVTTGQARLDLRRY